MDEHIRLHRCHHCATRACSFFEHRRVVEGGCPDYTKLDPLERKPSWELKNANGESCLRRIRKTPSMKFEVENIDFIYDVILPSNRKMFQGYFTRGVHACVDAWLAEFGEEVPIIPPIERESEYCRIEKKTSFLPETLEKIKAIRKHWRGTPHSTTNSQIVNHFITLTRERVEKANGGS